MVNVTIYSIHGSYGIYRHAAPVSLSWLLSFHRCLWRCRSPPSPPEHQTPAKPSEIWGDQTKSHEIHQISWWMKMVEHGGTWWNMRSNEIKWDPVDPLWSPKLAVEACRSCRNGTFRIFRCQWPDRHPPAPSHSDRSWSPILHPVTPIDGQCWVTKNDQSEIRCVWEVHCSILQCMCRNWYQLPPAGSFKSAS